MCSPLIFSRGGCFCFLLLNSDPNEDEPPEWCVCEEEPPLDENAGDDGALDDDAGDPGTRASSTASPPVTRAARSVTSPASANTAHGVAASPPKQISPRRSAGARPRFLTFTVGGCRRRTGAPPPPPPPRCVPLRAASAAVLVSSSKSTATRLPSRNSAHSLAPSLAGACASASVASGVLATRSTAPVAPSTRYTLRPTLTAHVARFGCHDTFTTPRVSSGETCVAPGRGRFVSSAETREG